jgi:hypothetical protein
MSILPALKKKKKKSHGLVRNKHIRRRRYMVSILSCGSERPSIHPKATHIQSQTNSIKRHNPHRSAVAKSNLS